MGIDLAGKSVLVTGASIGIGRETALRFAAAGCKVALTYFEHRGEDKRIVSVHPTVTATRMNDMRGMPPERVADVIFRVAAGEIEVEPGGDVDLRDYAEGR